MCIHDSMSTCLRAPMEASRERQIPPGNGLTDGCELPCGCWELNPGPLEDQPVLLTAEPSLQ